MSTGKDIKSENPNSSLKKYFFMVAGIAVIGAGFWGINSASQNSKTVKPANLESKLEAQFTVYKSPTCGCCVKWNDHLRTAGHEVTAINTDDLYAYKISVGVPDYLQSCHTAMVSGYVIEGHVPIKDIERLLSEKPDAVGLSVPGMVSGSPGMENGRSAPYDVFIFYKDGRYETYASH